MISLDKDWSVNQRCKRSLIDIQELSALWNWITKEYLLYWLSLQMKEKKTTPFHSFWAHASTQPWYCTASKPLLEKVWYKYLNLCIPATPGKLNRLNSSGETLWQSEWGYKLHVSIFENHDFSSFIPSEYIIASSIIWGYNTLLVCLWLKHQNSTWSTTAMTWLIAAICGE